MSAEYDGSQVVGLDLHRNRTVMVRMTPSGDVLESVRFANDAQALAEQIGKAGRSPEVVLEATNGWYWAVDVLLGVGASVHLAHPLGVKGFAYRRVKNDYRDAADLADLLRMGRLPEAWIATTQVRERRELVRHRHKLVQMRSSLKTQVHAVLAKRGVTVVDSDLFGVTGRKRLGSRALPEPFGVRVASGLLLGGSDTATPRVRPHRAPRLHHQTRLSAGPLGGRGGRATCRQQRSDQEHLRAHRGTPRRHRQEPRQGRRSAEAAHLGLLRPSRRRDPLPGRENRMSRSGPDSRETARGLTAMTRSQN